MFSLSYNPDGSVCALDSHRAVSVDFDLTADDSDDAPVTVRDGSWEVSGLVVQIAA